MYNSCKRSPPRSQLPFKLKNECHIGAEIIRKWARWTTGLTASYVHMAGKLLSVVARCSIKSTILDFHYLMCRYGSRYCGFSLSCWKVVDVELHRHSLREEYVFSQSSDSDLSDAPTSLQLPLNMPAPVKASSPIKQMHESISDASAEKGKDLHGECSCTHKTPRHLWHGQFSIILNNLLLEVVWGHILNYLWL